MSKASCCYNILYHTSYNSHFLRMSSLLVTLHNQMPLFRNLKFLFHQSRTEKFICVCCNGSWMAVKSAAKASLTHLDRPSALDTDFSMFVERFFQYYGDYIMRATIKERRIIVRLQISGWAFGVSNEWRNNDVILKVVRSERNYSMTSQKSLQHSHDTSTCTFTIKYFYTVHNNVLHNVYLHNI